jgi:hypothetical protein
LFVASVKLFLYLFFAAAAIPRLYGGCENVYNNFMGLVFVMCLHLFLRTSSAIMVQHADIERAPYWSMKLGNTVATLWRFGSKYLREI